MNKRLRIFSGASIICAGILELAVGTMEGRISAIALGIVCLIVGVLYIQDRKKK